MKDQMQGNAPKQESNPSITKSKLKFNEMEICISMLKKTFHFGIFNDAK